MCHWSIQGSFKSKVENRCQFFIFFNFLSEKIRKSAKPSLPSQTPSRPLEGVVSEIYPLPLLHLHSDHILQYGVWNVDMATSPAPICSNTKSKIFFNFLASKVWLLAVMDRTEEDALKRHERPRRQLNSHFLPKPLKQGDGPGHGEGAGGKKYHANGPLPLPLG